MKIRARWIGRIRSFGRNTPPTQWDRARPDRLAGLAAIWFSWSNLVADSRNLRIDLRQMSSRPAERTIPSRATLPGPRVGSVQSAYLDRRRDDCCLHHRLTCARARGIGRGGRGNRRAKRRNPGTHGQLQLICGRIGLIGQVESERATSERCQ